MSRSHRIAFAIHVLLSIVSIGSSMMILPRGAESLDAVTDTPPYFVVVAVLILGVLGLITAYGIWQGQRWAVLLTIALRSVDGLLALPGILWAPTPGLKVGASIGVVLNLLVIYFLLRREPEGIGQLASD
jgi:uncharacterized membrane protein (DUF2068 family)